MIHTEMEELSLNRQLSLTGVSKGSWYYAPAPETELNLALMLKIDKQFLETPFYGVPRMHQHLLRMLRSPVIRQHRGQGLTWQLMGQ